MLELNLQTSKHMKRGLYTLTFALAATAASAQISSSADIYISEGAIMSIDGDVKNNGTIVNKGQLHLKQNLQNEGTIASTGTVVFDGVQKQEVTSANGLELSKVVVENDIKLKSDLKVTEEMQYQNGIVDSKEATLVYGENAHHTGASDYSHSLGNVTKEKAAKFEYPVGDGNTYRGFETRASGNNDLTASYVAENPEEVSRELAVGVEDINHQEYWLLKSSDASEIATVKLIGTYDNQVAYLNRGKWSIAEGASLDSKKGIDRGVAFTSGKGKNIQKGIGIWPNPTEGEFNLKLTGMNSSDLVTVDVTNQDGRVVLTASGKVSDLRKVYALPASLVTTELTVRVINGDEALAEKLILNR